MRLSVECELTSGIGLRILGETIEAGVCEVL